MSLKKGTTTISGLGSEGFSPSASVSKSGVTTTITITDKNGTTTSQIVDENIQYSTMPTAGADTVGKVVQYTGTTDSNYTNGYFYKGISTTEGNETTYSWEKINVQDNIILDSTPTENSTNGVTSGGVFEALAGAGGGGLPVNVITTYPMPSSFDMANADVGIYQFEYQSTSSNIKYDVRYGYNIFKAYSDYIHEICVLKKVDWTTPPTQTEIWGYVTKWSNSTARLERYYCYRKANNTNGYTMMLLLSDSCLLTYNNTTINAVYTFNSLPVSSSTPTNNNHFTTKKYVDSLIAPTYSTSSTYDVDDLVIYSSKLYKCNTAITTAEAWDSTKWTETTLAEVLKGV